MVIVPSYKDFASINYKIVTVNAGYFSYNNCISQEKTTKEKKISYRGQPRVIQLVYIIYVTVCVPVLYRRPRRWTYRAAERPFLVGLRFYLEEPQNYSNTCS